MLAINIKAFTLFATHYFELTLLTEQIPTLANVHLDAVEHGDNIIFMHAIQEGAASKSFGLQVAQLAGVPKQAVTRAKQKLAELESGPQTSITPTAQSNQQQLPLIEDATHPVIEQIEAVDVNDLSPKQALDLLFELKAKL